VLRDPGLARRQEICQTADREEQTRFARVSSG
jgi:hypothetical protein